MAHEKQNVSDSGRPETLYRITKEGQSSYLDYLNELEQLIEDAQSSAETTDGNAPTFSPAT